MNESSRLLGEFAANGSEAAFAGVVRLQVDLVYSAALRLTAGDAHLAEDITQTVFTDLARKAASLDRQVLLGGWLYRHTFYVASKAIRHENRRRHREQIAAALMHLETETASDSASNTWKQIEARLDEALNRLAERDRNAILLRFFEQRDLAEVGTALGISEDAAQKCVSRALEKLRGMLEGHGATLSATVLGTALAANSIQAAPAIISASLAQTVLGSAAVSAPAFAKIMTPNLFKIAAALALATGLGTLLWPRPNTASPATAETRAPQKSANPLVEIQEPQKQVTGVAGTLDTAELDRFQNEHRELLQLRGEVNVLRRQLHKASVALMNQTAGDDPKTEGPKIGIECKWFEVPKEVWSQLDRVWTGTSQKVGVMTSAQYRIALAAVQQLPSEVKGSVNLWSLPLTKTADGQHVQISDIQAPRTQVFGHILDITPALSPDAPIINLDITVRCTEFVGWAEPGLSDTSAQTATIVVPPVTKEMFKFSATVPVPRGQTLVLCQEIPQTVQQDASEPKVALIFVTPNLNYPGGLELQ